ncbi:zinc-binding metallopeptidase family protein [Neorhodopirellula pilleata]|uniref:4Fe-4S ferredoxin-type domain-containing protein n=1 Tax=Neorhodopirellula pilleata TaxID=2714738 RepID=A0A5C6AP24_9BACT|nr:putative zinc-binding metallopeptidase [Neorhodopirellula pilleata]TWU01735.1 hypothetical protein Pla100_14700 [Neorhodopirellula pilleata]
MKTYLCQCGSKLFFHNDRCLNCGASVAMCPSCDELTALDAGSTYGVQCNRDSCTTTYLRCKNGVDHGICNRLVPTDPSGASQLCDYCRLTTVLPDLTVPGNIELWKRLERAKQRVLYAMERSGFPVEGGAPRLSFEFKADTNLPVMTGHEDGRITVNIREADSVAREIARVNFGEPQRTLVGHLRHELGHYFWDRLVRGQRNKEFHALFGDETNPDYSTAMQRYYDQGAPSNWRTEFVSAYASMHPWEDFAETFGAYHDMLTVLATANHFGVTNLELDTFDGLIRGYARVGVMANEFNRDMGLLDLVPEVFVPAVVPKLQFVHSLRVDLV